LFAAMVLLAATGTATVSSVSLNGFTPKVSARLRPCLGEVPCADRLG
jgi:hypothetical protein